MILIIERDATGRIVDVLTRHTEALAEFHPDTRADRLRNYYYHAPVAAGLVRDSIWIDWQRQFGGKFIYRQSRASQMWLDARGLIGTGD